MKKLLLALNILLLGSFIVPVNAQQAMYIYRNDSVAFNAFLIDEIDSVAYSVYDQDSVAYEGYVSQLVYTKDSLHIIPLARIDSISFITPEPILKPGVKIMREDYLPYIVAVDSTTIIFASNTPSELMPIVGDVLVGDIYEDALEDGFSGRVLSREDRTEGVAFLCEDVFITDVYERLVTVGAMESTTVDSTGIAKVKRASDAFTFELKPYKVKLNKNITLSVTPEATLKYEICIEPGKERVVAFSFIHTYNMEAAIELKYPSNDDEEEGGKSDLRRSMYEEYPFVIGPIPLPIAGCQANIQLGGFFNMGGEIDFNATLKGNMSFEHGVRWDSQGLSTTSRTISKNFDAEGSEISLKMDGHVELGIAVRLSACFVNSRLFSAGITALVGPQIAGNITYETNLEDLTSPGKFYNSIKDTHLDYNLYLGMGFSMSFFDPTLFFSTDPEIRRNVKFSGTRFIYLPTMEHSFPVWRFYLLPEFSQPVYSLSKTGAADFYITPKRDLIPFLPMTIGVTVFDENNNRVATKYFNEKYRFEKDWDYMQKLSISNLENQQNYTCYPAIKFFDGVMTALPKTNFTTGYPVSITDFTVTNATKQEDGFVYDGETYSYKFDVAVTVALSDSTKVEDWGYVYRDPKGDTTHISLSGLGNPYTDKRYVYYRNSANSSAQLYGYVKYQNETDYYYGQSNDYPLLYDTLCVDLGLSVKWASMNIGAVAPQDTGGYYAYAELQTKRVYSQMTYTYCTFISSTCTTNYSAIEGDENANLSGNPDYDVATATWADGWRMPSQAEMRELVDSCQWTFTSLENVPGYRVTGPNGNSIFLPLTGCIMGSSCNTIIGSNVPSGAAMYWTAEWSDATSYTGTGHANAWYLNLRPYDSSNPNASYWRVTTGSKYWGGQVRAVKDK